MLKIKKLIIDNVFELIIIVLMGLSFFIINNKLESLEFRVRQLNGEIGEIQDNIKEIQDNLEEIKSNVDDINDKLDSR
jgi:peptidoglycan hydrolase CwlO-like protein